MAEKEKQREKKKKPCKKMKLIQWRYDNGDIGAVLKGKREYFYPVTLESDLAINKKNEWLDHQVEKGKLKIEKTKELNLPAGVSNGYREEGFQSIEQQKAAFSDFMKMMRADGSENASVFMVNLTAMILSSYWLQKAMKIMDILNTYPLDSTETSFYASITERSGDTMVALRKICRSLMVSTTVRKSKDFKVEAPVILPESGEREILSAAWLQPRGYDGEYYWPAPYRDMAALLDIRYFKAKDVKSFMDRNPWCACVVYGKYNHPIRLKLNLAEEDILDRINSDWDIEQVNRLIAAYSTFMHQYFSGDGQEFLRVWKIAGDHLEYCLDSQPKTQPKMANSKRFQARILLSALISFVEFVYQTCRIPLGEAIAFRKELLTALLPGCYPQVERQEETKIEGKSSQEQFEQVLQALITTENLAHFYAIKKGQKIWLEKTEDEIDIWGYVREYKEKEKSVPYVVLLRDDLIGLAETLCPQITSFSNVLTEVRKEKLVYLHSTANARIKKSPVAPTESVTAYRLNLEALPISEECKQALLHKLEE